MEIEIISTETIKPSSPTPDHLRTFKISIVDQLTPTVFTKIVYFYLPPAESEPSLDNAAKSQLLKSSLSETLTHFYPFAGRMKGNLSIDCNDEGAIFVEARLRRRLTDVLNEPSDESLRQFLPLNQSIETDLGHPHICVQITFLECGGIAVGLLFFHKMADGVAISTFVTAWTAAARGGPGKTVNPPDLLTTPSRFPQKEFLADLKLPFESPENITNKRFVFSAPSIAALKSRSATAGQPKPPSRVESVAALLWKCATKAIRSNSETPKSSILFQSVNLRTRLHPPLPGNSTGNLVAYYPNETSNEESETDLSARVDKLKRGLIDLSDGYVKRLQEEKDPSTAILGRTKLFERKDADIFTLTSWCRFALQTADFGPAFGKQVWVCTLYLPFKNIFTLLDSNDGQGIDAWVCLRDQDMKVFETDRELLAYASTADPPVPIGRKIWKSAKL